MERLGACWSQPTACCLDLLAAASSSPQTRLRAALSRTRNAVRRLLFRNSAVACARVCVCIGVTPGLLVAMFSISLSVSVAVCVEYLQTCFYFLRPQRRLIACVCRCCYLCIFYLLFFYCRSDLASNSCACLR